MTNGVTTSVAVLVQKRIIEEIKRSLRTKWNVTNFSIISKGELRFIRIILASYQSSHLMLITYFIRIWLCLRLEIARIGMSVIGRKIVFPVWYSLIFSCVTTNWITVRSMTLPGKFCSRTCRRLWMRVDWWYFIICLILSFRLKITSLLFSKTYCRSHECKSFWSTTCENTLYQRKSFTHSSNGDSKPVKITGYVNGYTASLQELFSLIVKRSSVSEEISICIWIKNS
jgi:hypothetical protein